MSKSILLLFVVIILSSCQKDRFTVESEWLTPLVKTELTLSDLLPDSLSTTNSDNTVDLTYHYEYSLSELSDFFDVPDRIDTMEVTMESLVLEDRNFIDTIRLMDIYPAALLLHGQTQILPAQDVTTDEGTEIDVTEEFFSTATFKEGWIDIVISNDLPVEAEIIEFDLLNADDGEVVLNGLITNLQPFSSDSSSYDLAGKTVDGLLEMRVKRVKTVASSGPVLIDAFKGLRVDFTVRDLKPESATAIFPAQTLLNRADQTEYTFGGAQLTQIDIETGDILMKVSSTIEEAIILDYQIPFSTLAGQPGFIQKQWTIPAAPKGETIYIEERFPIDGFSILMKGDDPNKEPYTNHIYNILEARIEYSGIERSLSLSDKITVEFGLVDVKPYLVIGDAGYHEFELNDTFDIPLFKNATGGISLENASFDMNVVNSFGIEIALAASNIQGINSRKPNTTVLSSQELLTDILIGKASNDNGEFIPFDYNLTLDKSNSNLKPFLENMPDQINPNLLVKVRPYGTPILEDFAFNFSDVKAEFDFNIPLEVGLDSLTLASEQDINFEENVVTDGLKQVKFMVRGKNSFPIDAGIKVDFVDSDGNIIYTLFDGLSLLRAAEVDPYSQKTVGEMESEIEAFVSREEYERIKTSAKAVIKGQFNTENASRYKLYSDYSIDVKIITEFIYGS